MTATTRRPTTPATPITSLIAHTPVWQTLGACRIEDAELFFPVGESAAALEQAEEAKAVCRACLVVDRCLQWALETRQDVGVWGGLSEQDRRRIHHRKRRSYDRGSLSAVDHILQVRLGEYRELEAQGLEVAQIARALGTNVQTVHNVRQALAEATAEEVAAA